MNYSKEFKDAILRRMLPPNNESISKIASEEGLSEQLSATGGIRLENKVMPLQGLMLCLMNGAHRINF